MRPLIFATLSVAALAACEPTQPTTRVASGQDAGVCMALGDLGRTIMEVRQRGISQSELKGVIASRTSRDPQLQSLADGIGQAAYGVPIAPSVSAQQAVIREFGDVTQSACLSAVAK